MKKTKIIIPALGVLLLSTAASVTGTVAWFSMNNFVTATGMEVKAKAENGIVISNAASGSTWKETAETARTTTTTLGLKPTSTATGATWVHSTSNDSDDENTGNDYDLLSLTTDPTTGAGYVNDNDQTGYQATAGQTEGNDPVQYEADSTYYAMHSFYIKSSAEAIQKTIYITNVKATLPTTQNSENLNKALRVLVRLSSDASTAKVYSPVYAAAGYTVRTSSGKFDTSDAEAATTASVTPIDSHAANGLVAQASQTFLANQAIPGSSSAPLQIDIYLYFEGEDPNCKSTNLTASLDSIEVEVTFGTQTRNAQFYNSIN